MNKHKLFDNKIIDGSISDYKYDQGFIVEIKSTVDNSWSYLLYKSTVIALYNDDSVASGGFRNYSDEYAYIWVYLEPLPTILWDELLSVIERMILISGHLYSFSVFDTELNAKDITLYKDRGYVIFEGVDSVKLAKACGAEIIFNVSYRKKLS